jgi:hypothetical protein
MVQNSDDVIWIRRTLVICLMTWIAIRVGQLIVVVCVAVLTLYSDMLPCQRKLRCIMVKRRRLPGCGGMALRAGLRVALRLVIWIGRAHIVGTMAIDTVHRQRGELIVDMAVLAQHCLMNACQGEFRVVVRKRCRSPARRCVTRYAVCFELRCSMVRG